MHRITIVEIRLPLITRDILSRRGRPTSCFVDDMGCLRVGLRNKVIPNCNQDSSPNLLGGLTRPVVQWMKYSICCPNQHILCLTSRAKQNNKADSFCGRSWSEPHQQLESACRAEEKVPRGLAGVGVCDTESAGSEASMVSRNLTSGVWQEEEE